MNNNLKNNILFVAGGTGGHIFPALAVYNLFINFKNKLFFVTDQRGLRFEELSEIKPFLIKALGFEGKAFIKKLASIFLLLIATFKAILFIKKNQIKTIIGFGSYVQVPFILAALILKKNIVLHEGNAVMGKANKIFWKYINIRTSAYNLEKHYPDTLHIGMPVRDKILKLHKNKYLPVSKEGFISLLIIGGSQGSKVLSYKLSKAIVKLPENIKNRIIVSHQVRKDHLSLVRKIYRKNKIKFRVVSFFKNINHDISKASLIISRAGSSTIHENMIAGIPAIYFPIHKSVGNHQYENALVLKNKRAAWVLNETDIDNGVFLKSLNKIIINTMLLKRVSNNKKKLSKLNAAGRIKEIILNLERKSV